MSSLARAALKAKMAAAAAASAPSPQKNGDEREHYERLLEFMLENHSLLGLFARRAEIKQFDEVAACLLDVPQTQADKLQVLRAVLRGEFEKVGQESSGSILRGNSVATRLTTKFCRAESKKYLREALREWVLKVNEVDVELQVDEAKLKGGTVEGNKKVLCELVSLLIGRLSQERMVAVFPRGVRELAKFIGQLSEEHVPEQKWPLVGGLVLLRLLNPTIITPQEYEVVDGGLSRTCSRNLIIVARVMQNLSNKQRFKDPAQSVLNEFLEANEGRVRDFLGALILHEDPPAPEEARKPVPIAKLKEFVRACIKMQPRIEEDLKAMPEVGSRFNELLRACPNAFKNSSNGDKKQQLVRSLSSMLEKRTSAQTEFEASLASMTLASGFLAEIFSDAKPSSSWTAGGDRFEKLVAVAEKLAHEKYGVTTTQKGGRKEGNRCVFVAEDAVTWLKDSFQLKDREQPLVLLRDMVSQSLVVPFKEKKKEHFLSPRRKELGDNDALFYFDYEALDRWRRIFHERKKNLQDVKVLREVGAYDLSALCCDSLRSAGVLKDEEAGKPTKSVRERWTMLLEIAHLMCTGVSDIPIRTESKQVSGETHGCFFFSWASKWMQKHLLLQTSEQARVILDSMITEGFVNRAEGDAGVKLFYVQQEKVCKWWDKFVGDDKTCVKRGGTPLAKLTLPPVVLAPKADVDKPKKSPRKSGRRFGKGK